MATTPWNRYRSPAILAMQYGKYVKVSGHKKLPPTAPRSDTIKELSTRTISSLLPFNDISLPNLRVFAHPPAFAGIEPASADVGERAAIDVPVAHTATEVVRVGIV